MLGKGIQNNPSSPAVRWVVGVIVAGLTFTAILQLSSVWLVCLAAVAFFVVALEWGRLCEKQSAWAWVHPLFFVSSLITGLTIFSDSAWLSWAFYVAVSWWLVMFFVIAAYQASWKDAAWLRWLFRSGSSVVLVANLGVIFLLHTSGLEQLIYLIGLVIVADTAAYLCGRRFGQKKLIPEISPNKTLAGFWGAMMGTLVYAAGLSFYFHHTWLEQISFVLMGLVLALFCIVGDLSESLLKRQAGVKDSGNLLPGHGGLFDRLDSFLAAAPVFVFLDKVI